MKPRLFVSIARTVDLETGAHILDAVADDGSAWWRVISVTEEKDTGWTPMTPLPKSSQPD